MGKYLTKIGLTKYTTKLKEYISKAKVASAASADNAIKVNNHTVDADVPANAKFTDTDTWRPLGTTADTACAGNDSRLSNARPANDVYAWAKASTKPTYTKSEVGLGNVDNTADADKSVKYAATAGSANSVAWSNVSGKPTLGNAASKTTRGLNSVGTCGWAGGEIDKNYVPDMTFMAWWNGAYSETASNLAYCNKGAFGTAATANKGDFAPASHTHNYLPLSGGVISSGEDYSIDISPSKIEFFNESGSIKISGAGISDNSESVHIFNGDTKIAQLKTLDNSPIIDIDSGITSQGHVWSAVILRNGYDRSAYCIMNIRMKLQLGGLWMTLPFNFANSDYNVTVSRQFDSYCRAVPNNIASISQYVYRTQNYFMINTGGNGDAMYNAYNYGEADDTFFVTVTGEVPY